MVTNDKASLSLEIAHVLFIDIVSYSSLLIDKQRQVLQQLQSIVRSTKEFERAQDCNQLICLPTGDGMALVYFGDPIAPIRCAIEISLALRCHPEIRLRMGIHSGPVYRIADINANMNVAGGGINTAQRVMDCGDDGHILLSKRVVDDLRELSNWAESLYDLGEAKVKNTIVHVFAFHNGEVGNPNIPMKLRSSSGSPTAPARQTYHSTVEPLADSSQKRVALLYKRNAQPDEYVLKVLEIGLRARGYNVFIDRHLTIGVEWAKEIERQVCMADAVIPLLSANAVTSEMLAYEVQIAHEAAQKQNGRPRLLPVRIDFQSSLPDPLGSILSPIQHALWNGKEDDQKLTEELHYSIQSPAAPKADPMLRLESPGGAVPLDSKFYITRPTDKAFLLALKRRDSIVLVKGARQMGKTSLLARGLQQAREAGSRVVLTDLQKLNAAHLESIDALFLTLAEMVSDQLNVGISPDEVWNTRRGPSINFERYIRREILNKVAEPIVWGLDEVDRLFTCSFGSEVFGLFRSWHNERSLDPESPWERLTLAIAYATEAHLFITDPNQSPFNIGTRLELKDFSINQVLELNSRYGQPPLQSTAEVDRYYSLLSGHPYLIRRGLHEMLTHEITLTVFENLADRDEGPFGDHLRRILVLLARDPALCDVMRDVLRGRPCPSPESFYRLRSAGIISGYSERDAQPRCQLYKVYLERHLL